MAFLVDLKMRLDADCAICPVVVGVDCLPNALCLDNSRLGWGLASNVSGMGPGPRNY